METHSMRKIYLVEEIALCSVISLYFMFRESRVTGLSFNIHIFVEYNLLGNRRLDDLPNAGTTVLQPWTTPRVPWRIEQIKVPRLCVACVCASGRRPLPPYARFRVTLVSGGGR